MRACSAAAAAAARAPPPPTRPLLLLLQWFSSIDTDRSGKLDVFELQRALAMGGLNFSLKTVQALMRLHDRDHGGTIEFAVSRERVGGWVGGWGADAARGTEPPPPFGRSHKSPRAHATPRTPPPTPPGV